MPIFAHAIASLLISAQLAAPVLAQNPLTNFFSSSTSPIFINLPSFFGSSFGSSTAGGGGNSLLGIGLGIGAGLLGFGLLSSAASSLTGISFGGRVVAIVPCSGGMLHVTILAARIIPRPEFYIWTPFTITKLAGPPTHPGQQILGRADVPFVCFIGGGGFSSPVPLYGLRMQVIGTSAI